MFIILIINALLKILVLLRQYAKIKHIVSLAVQFSGSVA